MKKLLLLLPSFLAFFLLVSTKVSAQAPPPPSWTTVPMAFTGQIHIVKFLDAVGAPLEGFVGDDTGISYTRDGGTTWKRATILSPKGYVGLVTGYVTDITFKNDSVGFAILDSVYNNDQNPDSGGVLITTDSGRIWNIDDTLNTPDSGRGIYYNVANNRLYVASADLRPGSQGLVVSTDNGGTWTVLDTNKYYTGFAFNGNGYGVVATEGTICNSRTQNLWLSTTDGGVTWQKTRMFTQSWQPLGIPTTETFFASSANNCSGIANALMRSDDGGYGFSPIPSYTSGGNDTLSEDMAGDGCEQFASSFATHTGMWYSTNDGANWQIIPSSPNPAVDTRFYVSPDTVWSFAYDSLKWIPRPATADIHVWPDTVAFKNAACQTNSDTTIHIFGCNCANTIQLVKDSIHRFNDTSTAPVQILPAIPPAISLCSGGLGVADAVTIQFQPNSDLADTADYHLIFNDNGTTVDTVIHMTANGIHPVPPPFPTKAISLSGPACSGVIDTCIEITNESCSTLIFEGGGSSLNESPQCQNELQMTGFCELQKGNVTLAPGQSWCFEIDFVPGLVIGCCDASAQLEYKTADGTLDTLTNFLQVVGCTTTNLKPSFRGFNINRANCCDVPDDTTIYFVNSTCDTIELRSPVITGHTSCANNFKIDTTAADNNGFPLTFPLFIPPNQHVPLTISLTCEATNCVAYIKFPYTIRANFASVACAGVDSTQFATDSLIDTVSLTTQAIATPPKVTSSINFGSVNCCDSTDMKTITITAGCKPDTLKGLLLINSKDTNFVLDTAGDGLILPMVLSPGQQVSFQVGFLPHCDGGSGGSDNGTMVDSMSSGIISTPIGATSTNLATANLSTDSVSFDSVESCAGQSCKTVTFTNASCGPIKIVVNTPPQNACMTVSGVTTNTIPVGGNVQVTACLNPSACGVTGTISNMVIFQITDQNGANFTFDTVTLNAFIDPPVPLDSLTQLANMTICDSSTITESFSLTNLGTCYTYDIVSASTGNPQVTVTPPGPYPIHIDSGTSQSFSVTFSPTSVGNFTGTITLTDSDGTTIQVPYDFTDTNCASQVDTLVFNFPNGGSFITPNCTPEGLNFTAGSSAGGGIVDSVTITGSAQFTTPLANGTALPYTGTVTYNPNTGGNNTATITVTVTVNGSVYTKSSALTGMTVGVKDSARIGVLGLTQGCILPNDTMLDTFAIVLRDTIEDTMGVTQLTFVINYNDDLLWNLQAFDTANGWHVSSIKDSTDGIHVTLTYSGNPPIGYSPANDTLLKISQLGAISESVTSTARITNAHFNDSAFEACSMKALSSSGDSANICIDTSTCGGRLLQPAVAGNLQPVTGIQVVPNPAHKGSGASTLHFTTNIDANVTADVLDVLGHSVVTLTTGALESGDHALEIPTDQMPEGAYFARINVNGYTVIRQFVLVKE